MMRLNKLLDVAESTLQQNPHVRETLCKTEAPYKSFWRNLPKESNIISLLGVLLDKIVLLPDKQRNKYTLLRER